MDLYTDEIDNEIKSVIIDRIHANEFESAINNIENIVRKIHDSIPHKKRISYGIHYVVKTLGKHLFEQLKDLNQPVGAITEGLYGNANKRQLDSKAVSLQMMSLFAATNRQYLNKASLYFRNAASSSDWVMREHAAGFFRKVIQAFPQEAEGFLVDFSLSKDEKIRRFSSEALRPVADGQWLQKRPDYSLNILRNMFREPSIYPRTSIGNNLSDLARCNSDVIYDILEELVGMHDKNSHWIAYRACRNMVKKEPYRVMDILGIDEYRYKERYFSR